MLKKEQALHSRSDAPASRRADGDGLLRRAPSHRRLPRSVHARAGRREGIHRHKERRAGALVVGHRLYGSLDLEPDFARRQRSRADRRQVRRALDLAGQGVWLRRRDGNRSLRRNLFAGRSAPQADARHPLRLCAGDREFHRRAPRRRGDRETGARITRYVCLSSTPSPASAQRVSTSTPGESTSSSAARRRR